MSLWQILATLPSRMLGKRPAAPEPDNEYRIDWGSAEHVSRLLEIAKSVGASGPLKRPNTDFGATQAPSHCRDRPFHANSQCSKILAAMERGQRMTAYKVFTLTGATASDRRLREVCAWLRKEGRALRSDWRRSSGGARHLEIWLADPQNGQRERRSIQRGRR